MPISTSDIKVRYSIPTATSGNLLTQSRPSQSLGGFISTTDIPGDTIANLFENVLPEQNSEQIPLYKAFFVYNAHATIVLRAVSVYLLTGLDVTSSLTLGVDPTAASAVASNTAQALAIAQSTTLPVGVSFSAASSLSTSVSLGDLSPGMCRCVWVRLTPPNASAAFETATLVVRGQSQS